MPASQEEELAARQAQALLAELLRGLDADKRTILELYEFEELQMRDVVEIVGCPLQTGYSRLKSARRLVREAAAERLGEAAEQR